VQDEGGFIIKIHPGLPLLREGAKTFPSLEKRGEGRFF